MDGRPLSGPSASETVVNQAAVELLRRLPGVTDANYRPLMAALPNLAALVDMPAEELGRVMGSVKAAQVLLDFLNAPFPRQ